MPRTSPSQWDFGDLFAPRASRQVWTVSELTLRLKRLLESEIGQVCVTGEVSNLRLQSSGHTYFTLKDAGAQLNCVLFRGEAAAARSLLEDGRKVLLQGVLTVYEPRGQYQLVVRQVELQGLGALQVAFEKLKQRLQAEGWFAAERKRPLPRYPQRIGLVTSPDGAAMRDVLHVVQRRYPGLGILLAPCRVQGEGAATEIAAAIRLLNAWSAGAPAAAQLAVILVTRGGGSLEDLWAFNEETVARAIFESALPVISAVGHEIDFTISDFVADVRAATPSAAAEILTEGFVASRAFVAEAAGGMTQRVRQPTAGAGASAAPGAREASAAR
jgi:exodeoxyribonuclease VII large subunit